MHQAHEEHYGTGHRWGRVVECVRQGMLLSPNRSALRHCIELGISNLSVRRIQIKDLHFHRYKSVLVQQLKPRDFAGQMKAIFKANDSLILLVSDEAYELTGLVIGLLGKLRELHENHSTVQR